MRFHLDKVQHTDPKFPVPHRSTVHLDNQNPVLHNEAQAIPIPTYHNPCSPNAINL